MFSRKSYSVMSLGQGLLIIRVKLKCGLCPCDRNLQLVWKINLIYMKISKEKKKGLSE